MFRFTLFILLAFCFSSEVPAQDSPTLAPQPIFVARFHGWTQSGARQYLQRLNEDLEIGGRILAEMNRPEAKENAGTLDNPVNGIMLYLTQALIPSVEQVAFSEVADEAEFRKFVQIQKRQQGDGSTLEGGDDKYKIAMARVVKVPLPNDNVIEQISGSDIDIAVDTAPPANSVSVGIGTQGLMVTTTQTNSTIETEDGKRYSVQKTNDETWYRFHEGFMFTAKSATLWDMPLPSAEALRDQSDPSMNGVMAFYPDRIPMGLRHLGWGALSGAAGPVLQQYDGEADDVYAMRQLSGEAGLNLVKAILFDTQEISSWMKLPLEEDVLRGEFRIEARKSSDLGRSLREFGMGNSRFAPILNDDAAATLHLNVNLPDEWKLAVEAFRTYALNEAAKTTESSIADASAILTRAVCSSADHGTVEALVKIGWTPASGAAVYGGLQFDQSPGLLNAFMTMIRDGATGVDCASIQKGDLQMVQISIPRDACPEFVHISHLFLAHENSCLWFALGGENSHEIIQQAIAHCNDTAGLIQTPVLTAKADIERWLAYPQNDPTGLTRLPVVGSRLLVEVVSQEIGLEISEPDSDYIEAGESAFDESTASESSASHILQVLRMRGSQELSVVIQAEESGLVVRSTVGSAIARAIMAQCIVWADDMVPTRVHSEDSTP